MSNDPQTTPGAADALKPDSMLAQLVDTIGWPATIQLCGRFGGEIVYIPQADSVLKAERNANVVRDHHRGESYKSIADRYGITTSYVRAIVARST